MKKLHIPHPLYTAPKGGKPFVPLCGAFAVVEMAESIKDVTCKKCLRRIVAAAKKLDEKRDLK